MIFLVVAVTLPSKLAIFPLFFIRDHRKRTKPARGHTISLRPRNILTSPTLDSIERIFFFLCKMVDMEEMKTETFVLSSFLRLVPLCTSLVFLKIPACLYNSAMHSARFLFL